MILVDDKTGEPLKLGQQIKTFRGTVGRLVGFQLPTREYSTGRVILQINGHDAAYYPGIIGAKWVKKKDSMIQAEISQCWFPKAED